MLMSKMQGTVSDDDDLFLPQPKSSGLVHLENTTFYGNPDTDEKYFANGLMHTKNAYNNVTASNDDLPYDICCDPLLSNDQLSRARVQRQGSIVDGLLHEIYDRWQYGRSDSIDSDTLTECSSTSEFLFHSRHESGGYHSERRHAGQLNRSFLQNQSETQLKRILSDLQRSITVMNVRLVKQLKRRDRCLAKLQRNYDIVTAILQAASLKRQIDTRMKFSIQPPPGQSAFDQWRDAMKAVCRLPMGMPPEFRKKVWLSLADHYLLQLKISWESTVRFVFNERSNPDDEQLGMQIVKDLHRTGCSNFSGDDNGEDRAVLKRMLLAYARWNKRVGYCQGFNVIAALLLNVMDRKEDDALKVMIYLIDSVLPESYFANNLRALSVDMAVFRDLLKLTYPKLSKHLDKLQMAAQDVRTGACYEPPLTNVFTMQWFLTLFATCLPVNIVLRVWDSILLEGSEILLRTALTIWGKLAKRIMGASSADEFYCLMGDLSSSIMQGMIFDGDAMIKSIYSLGEFPFPHVHDLREKYTYNIRPFTEASGGGKKSGSRIKSLMNSDEDDIDDDLEIAAMACMPGDVSASSDISVLGPGVYGSSIEEGANKGAPQMERMTTDIQSLKLQYERLKQRQQQAHIIIAAASAKKAKPESALRISRSVLVPSIESPTAMNHLFIGKGMTSTRNRLVTDGPKISAPAYGRKNSGVLAQQLQAVANAQAVSKSQRMRTGSSVKVTVPQQTSAPATPVSPGGRESPSHRGSTSIGDPSARDLGSPGESVFPGDSKSPRESVFPGDPKSPRESGCPRVLTSPKDSRHPGESKSHKTQPVTADQLDSGVQPPLDSTRPSQDWGISKTAAPTSTETVMDPSLQAMTSSVSDPCLHSMTESVSDLTPLTVNVTAPEITLESADEELSLNSPKLDSSLNTALPCQKVSPDSCVKYEWDNSSFSSTQSELSTTLVNILQGQTSLVELKHECTNSSLQEPESCKAVSNESVPDLYKIKNLNSSAVDGVQFLNSKKSLLEACNEKVGVEIGSLGFESEHSQDDFVKRDSFRVESLALEEVCGVITRHEDLLQETSIESSNESSKGGTSVGGNSELTTTLEKPIINHLESCSMGVTEISIDATNINTQATNINSEATNISTEGTNISTEATNISTEASNNISTEATNISTEATNISTEAANISTEAANISTEAANISTEATNISTEATNISTEATNISTEATNISTDATKISTEATNISIEATDIDVQESAVDSTDVDEGGHETVEQNGIDESAGTTFDETAGTTFDETAGTTFDYPIAVMETVPVPKTVDLKFEGILTSSIQQRGRKSSSCTSDEDRIDKSCSHPRIRKVSQHSVTACNRPSHNLITARRYSSPARSETSMVGHLPVMRKASTPFNPFPVKHLNANRVKTGLKLGLYTPSTLEQFGGRKSSTSS